ncbi:3-isopropylmalate dehydrogenase [Iodidimonas gelatinilytica]|uniref:3-isopropylmalate dehydrogenase n=1 Tax=Iodidimonas gelatinilytica TaxID=1236966 RepID=A0A5A7MNI9_9PROT|nr:3-isopropylmalate dehydrogenase [Iodidimonas gelatinilytica]GEQ96528.1 3-isopropylmalate dehydrogenase [Iodidimonas gelatinilytica]GER00149.1 3-isopropylmalate dehydrogenase [Iodidimonas gelatinilytica]
MSHRILLLPGDGIGPEVVEAGCHVLDHLATATNFDISYETGLIGGAAIDATGVPMPAQTLEAARRADAVLLGAVGGPQWHGLPGDKRPEAGLLALRAALGVFANLRPIRVRPQAVEQSPIKREIAEGSDILFVRELTGGLYFGDKGTEGDAAYDVCRYSRTEIERVVRLAADAASSRRGRLTLVDKANVMETSRLWRAVTEEIIAQHYKNLDLEILLVDAATMHLLTRPRDFDVIVTENLFGDILTDEASVLTGSIGLIPSASLGATGAGLYEPVHGSAPDIAGQGKANPIGMIESIA